LLHLIVGTTFIILSFSMNQTLGIMSIPGSFAAVHLPAAFVAMAMRKKVFQQYRDSTEKYTTET
jgi:TRAP-type C4-dicarboxylate transport system permease small subunit